MLKIRNLIFALGLSPLTLAVWQLPSQAGGNAPGNNSGNNNNTGSTITPFSVPPAALPAAAPAAAAPGAAPATPATAAAAEAAGAAGAATTTTTVGGETIPALVTVATTVTGAPVIIPLISGVSATITTGVSTTGATSVATTTTVGDTGITVAVTAASVESTSSSVIVTDAVTGNSVEISVPVGIQINVNQLAAAIVQNLNSIITGGGTTGGGTTGGGTTGGGTTDGGTTGGGTTGGGTTGGGTTDGGTTGGGTTGGGTVADVGALLTGGAGAQQAAVALTNSFTAAGISPRLATALVTALTGVFSSTSASLQNQPVAMTTSGQLVASTKAFKPVTIIAQGSAGISVNMNKLNNAIVAYNSIILQSESKAVKNLSNNSGFRGIGSILKQLRTAIK